MKKIKPIILLFVVVIILVLGFYPMESYISRPGGAYELTPFVEVDGGDKDDEGTFSLLTIALSKATPLTYAYAKVMDSQKIYKANQIRQEDEDEEEYNVRQLKLMSDSQFNAISVAFDRAKKPFTVINHGIFIFNVIDGGGADNILKAGDKILEMDELTDLTGEIIADYLASKKEGDKIRLKVERDGDELTKEVTLKAVPGVLEKAGIGISYTENKVVETTPVVEIHSEDIGGPSAGLMFTLEILNQLLPEDITKGYNIAGTGEMLPDGTVGRIGGIDLKVIAADKKGAEIMFAPDDEIAEEILAKNPDLISNYEEAMKSAEKIGTNMKIVPVKTIDDALAYLDKLEPK
ncbi:SepM family pheromone-processing serine protease [Psychrobacillus sp. FSL K6-2684]|uniref:endopeptidase La n=1 Tax=Psychrobacillus faecigallinarum TaxID=2762235 RepID=A0ABR8R4Y6_9BACI|nr:MULTISPECIES: SepM family pheromone-processing serine protease [Psychrobacillus]MBD7942816.1 PDZ domain-containing protein [Psychrobacillus faecigallinarum]QEY20289.1 PDZ domain-containing protein [Psychrobacillus sp. AK 1817]